MSIIKKWNEVMEALSFQGSWYCSDKVAPPSLKVNGDNIYYPINPDAINKMKAVAQQAPFGRGTQTLIDETVRKGLQIDPSLVVFSNPESWNSRLQAISQELKNAYGRDNISLHFYKMLLYEEGGHFASHKDTLRDKTHIASLLISLPVEGGCEGGVLRVSGPGAASSTDAMEWDGRCDDVEGSWCSFYTDCQHELLPVVGGKRVVLSYQVHSESPLQQIDGVVSERDRASVVEVLDKVLPLGSPLILLKHQYPTGCEPKHLKGFDRTLFELIHQHYQGQYDVFIEGMELNVKFKYPDPRYEDEDNLEQEKIEYTLTGTTMQESRSNEEAVQSTKDAYPFWCEDKPFGQFYDRCDTHWLTSEDSIVLSRDQNCQVSAVRHTPTKKKLKSQYFNTPGFVFLFNTDNFERRRMIRYDSEDTGNEGVLSEDFNYKFYTITIEAKKEGKAHVAMNNLEEELEDVEEEEQHPAAAAIVPIVPPVVVAAAAEVVPEESDSEDEKTQRFWC